jgi:integrase
MANKTTGLPSGASAVSGRPGLYRLRVMIHGRRYSEYYRPGEMSKKKLQAELQKAVDAFRERVERGALKGQITDKSKLVDAAEWYLNTAKLKLRESTWLVTRRTFDAYILPTLGSFPLRAVTSARVTSFLAELLENGGGHTVYTVRPAFIDQIKASIRHGETDSTAALIGVSPQAFLRVRASKPVRVQTAQKTAEYYGMPLDKIFARREESAPLSAATVNRINVVLSAMFTALVHNDILQKNPCANATKPRQGERPRGAFLDHGQLAVFAAALERVENDNTRVALLLMLQLGLRSGEARALRWADVDFRRRHVSINHSAGITAKGLIIGETKTARSRRKIPLTSYLCGTLTEHRERQADYSTRLGSLWTENGLIITNPTGGIMTKDTALREVKRIAQANPSLPPDLHPHSLRHTFATLLIGKGLDVVSVAGLVGDTVDVVSRIYAHALADRQAAAMDKVGAVFAQAFPARPVLLASVDE